MMSSAKTKRLTNAAASPRRSTSGSHTRSMIGSKSSSASRPRAASDDAQRTAAAPTAGSTSWQRALTWGLTCSARLLTVAGTGDRSPFSMSSSVATTAARTLGLRSWRPYWRKRVQSGSRKASASALTQA